jgi:hypothetical protein
MMSELGRYPPGPQFRFPDGWRAIREEREDVAYPWLMPKAKPPAKRGPSAKKAKSKREVDGECSIPPRVPDEVLTDFKYKGSDEEAQQIVDYVEWQSQKDKEHVTFLEKVQTEYVLGEAHHCWNVHTNKRKWWVITGPTNLYSQALFPSLDYTISFHLGLMLRLHSKRKGTDDARLGDRLAAAFRRWEQAAQALDESNESEEVQAVGMRCRETLLAFIRSVGTPEMVPAGEVTPQASNFIDWAKLIANGIAQGMHNERIRGYLKALATETWQLVGWLTHAANAGRHDGAMVVDATHSFIEAFGTALIRHERQVVERCGRCGSLRLIALYNPEVNADGAACLSCGWEFFPDQESGHTLTPKKNARRHSQ